MDLKQKLLQFLTDLPEVDGPDKRKALLALTGFSHLGIYLDWQGSNTAFFPRLLAAFGRRDQEALVQFLGELQKQLHLGTEKQEIVSQLQREVGALDEEVWQQQFAATAVAGEQPDPQMLATSIFSTVLTPYFKLGEEALRRQAGANAVRLAERVWQRVTDAFAGDAQAADSLDLYPVIPEKVQPKLIPRLSRRLEEEPVLAQQLASLLARTSQEEEVALRTLISVAQEVGTVKGELVAAIFGKDALPAGADVDVKMKIDLVEGTAVGLVLGDDGRINVGAQHTYGDRVEGDKVEGGKHVVDTGGGTYIEDGVETGGGDFTGRDKTIQGNKAPGEKRDDEETDEGSASGE